MGTFICKVKTFNQRISGHLNLEGRQEGGRTERGKDHCGVLGRTEAYLSGTNSIEINFRKAD